VYKQPFVPHGTFLGSAKGVGVGLLVALILGVGLGVFDFGSVVEGG
jgi:hypothetical protein